MKLSDISSIQESPGILKEVIGVGFLLLVAIGFFSPMIFGGQAIFYRDYNLITYPIRHFLAQAFHQGAIPYWLPNIHGGEPFMASFHPGVFYPPSVVFFLADTTYAINIFYVLHFVVMGIFTFLLARCWGISIVSAVACGVTGMLSGFLMASTLVSNLFIAAVWLPMVFWMFHRCWTRKHWGYYLGLVLAIFIQTLAACPEISMMTMLLLYAHSLYFLPRSPGVKGVARLTASMGLAVVLALGLSALQLVPTAKLVQHTFRDGGLSFKEHSQWSADPSKLLTFAITSDYQDYFDTQLPPIEGYDEYGNLLVSNASGPTEVSAKSKFKQGSGLVHTYYMGLIGLLFVFMVFLFRREKPVGFWLVVFWWGIFLALGKYNPAYSWIYSALPFLEMFRYPEKYIYLSSFAVIFLTGFGLDILIRRTRERQIKMVSVLVPLLILSGAVAWLAFGKAYLSPEYSLALLLVFGFAYVMLYFKKINESAFIIMVLLMVLVDLSMKGTKLLPLIDRDFYEEEPVLMDIVGDSFGKHRIYSGKLYQKPNHLAYPKGPTRLAQIIASKEQLIPYMGMIYGLEHVNGYAGLALTVKDNFLWQELFVRSPPERRRRLLTRSNVKYWIDGDQLTGYHEGFPVILPDRVKVLKEALPRAFMVSQARVPKEGEHVLNIYLEESFDPRKEVLLYEAVEFAPSDHFDGKVEEVSYRPNRVTLKTRQEGNGFLVLLDNYFPGWTVKVDGQEQPILRANHFYRAVQLGPGAHTLEFEYFPEGLKEGLIVSAATILIGMVGCVFWVRRSQASTRTPMGQHNENSQTQ